MAKNTKAAAATLAAVLTLAEVSALTPTAAADAYGERSRIRTRAFVEQGKLVHHLDTSRLRAGQTVYGLLKGRGVPEGSINNARMAATCLRELVVSNLLPEDRFDEIITFRIARQASRLLTGKAAIKLEPSLVAALLKEGTSEQVHAELDCLAENGQTVAEREKHLADEAIRKDDAAKAAAAADALKAAAALKEQEAADRQKAIDEQAAVESAAAIANTIGILESVPTPTPAEPAPTSEQADDVDGPAPVVVDARDNITSITASSAPAAAPPAGSKADAIAILGAFSDAATQIYDLTDPADVAKAIALAEQVATDLKELLTTLQQAAA